MLLNGVNGLHIVLALSLVAMEKDQDFASVQMAKEVLIKVLKDVKVMHLKSLLAMKDNVYLVRHWLLISPKEELNLSIRYMN